MIAPRTIACLIGLFSAATFTACGSASTSVPEDGTRDGSSDVRLADAGSDVPDDTDSAVAPVLLEATADRLGVLPGGDGVSTRVSIRNATTSGVRTFDRIRMTFAGEPPALFALEGCVPAKWRLPPQSIVWVVLDVYSQAEATLSVSPCKPRAPRIEHLDGPVVIELGGTLDDGRPWIARTTTS